MAVSHRKSVVMLLQISRRRRAENDFIKQTIQQTIKQNESTQQRFTKKVITATTS